MPKMNTRCALPSTAPLLHAGMEGTTNADTLHAIAPNMIATPSKRSPRSGAATTVKHTPNTMIAHATIARPTTVLADADPAMPNCSSNARPADMKGRSASPCRSPSPITAPMVAAAATAPTRSPTEIRESVIAPKRNGPDQITQGHDCHASEGNCSPFVACMNGSIREPAEVICTNALLALHLTVIFSL